MKFEEVILPYVREQLAKVSAPRKYLAHWDLHNEKKHQYTDEVSSDYFSEENGYDAEQRRQIMRLQPGEKWVDSGMGKKEHWVKRIA